MNLLLSFDSFPNDSGPIYQETMAGRLPVEPFNTFSNIFFLFIIIHFSLKVYSDYRNHRFLAWSLPVLFFLGVHDAKLASIPFRQISVWRVLWAHKH